MNVMQKLCANCAGMGRKIIWKAVIMSDNMSAMEKEEVVCGVCNGKGHTKYATFTLEEAKAILKHCGLSTDGTASGV